MRRRWDSNPRGLAPYLLSKEAHSTTLTRLQTQLHYHTTRHTVHKIDVIRYTRGTEGWMSGLNQRFTKPPAFTGPRVRISLPPH